MSIVGKLGFLTGNPKIEVRVWFNATFFYSTNNITAAAATLLEHEAILNMVAFFMGLTLSFDPKFPWYSVCVLLVIYSWMPIKDLVCLIPYNAVSRSVDGV